jgi:hypothetical protein
MRRDRCGWSALTGHHRRTARTGSTSRSAAPWYDLLSGPAVEPLPSRDPAYTVHGGTPYQVRDWQTLCCEGLCRSIRGTAGILQLSGLLGARTISMAVEEISHLYCPADRYLIDGHVRAAPHPQLCDLPTQPNQPRGIVLTETAPLPSRRRRSVPHQGPGLLCDAHSADHFAQSADQSRRSVPPHPTWSPHQIPTRPRRRHCSHATSPRSEGKRTGPCFHRDARRQPDSRRAIALTLLFRETSSITPVSQRDLRTRAPDRTCRKDRMDKPMLVSFLHARRSRCPSTRLVAEARGSSVSLDTT